MLAILICQIVLIGDYQVDDAYISFAFAKNLAAGNGLTYGAGLKVEGYSNFLWTVVAGLVQLIVPNDLYFGMRIVGFACVLLTLIFAYRLTASYAGRRWAWCPVFLLAFATDLSGAALSALETDAYVAALMLTVYCYLTESRVRRRSSGWCLLLLALVRIDGIVHVAFILGWTGLTWLWERRAPRMVQVFKWLAAPLSVYALYFAWRYSYYGLPLPSTYYAKSLIHTLMPDQGPNYVWAAIEQLGLIVMGAFSLIGVVRRPRRERLMLPALVLYHLAYVAHVGGDWMPFHRFVLPALPLLAVSCSWGAYAAWRLVRRTPWPIRGVVAAGLAAGLGYVAVLQDGHSIDTPQERGELGFRKQVAEHTLAMVDASRVFRWLTRQPGETLVTDYGGVFAYYTDAAIIEMWGLCNADIALYGNANGINPIYGKTCISCYPAFNPTYFHANVPLLRRKNALNSKAAVIAAIFQADAIGPELDFANSWVAGRVVDTERDLAFYFLERKRGLSFEPRNPAPGILVEYPF